MPRKITTELLEVLGACGWETGKFKEMFPKGAIISIENFTKIATKEKYTWVEELLCLILENAIDNGLISSKEFNSVLNEIDSIYWFSIEEKDEGDENEIELSRNLVFMQILQKDIDLKWLKPETYKKRVLRWR